MVAGFAAWGSSKGPIVADGPGGNFTASLGDVAGVVAVLLEAGAVLGALLDVFGYLLFGVHVQKDSGFTGKGFQFFVGLARSGPPLLLFVLDALAPGVDAVGVAMGADFLVVAGVVDLSFELGEVLMGGGALKGVEPVL